MAPWIGVDVPRADGAPKVTGLARYVADMRLPAMLYGRVVRSPIPHGRIRRVDVRAALRVPGVVAVLTGADLADIDPYYGHAIKDRPVVAIDRVRFIGEPVAAVAAETEPAAEAAARAVEVDYEELPAATELNAALQPDAPQVHDAASFRPGLFHGLGELRPLGGNLCYHHGLQHGDLTAAMAAAAHVVEGEYAFPSVYQYAMEPHATLADVTPHGVTLWANCQHPYLVRAEIADLFRLPLSAVRIIVPFLGGGFGSKSYTRLEPIATALSRKARRPVLLVNTIEEAMLTTRRHSMRCWMRTAADATGRLVAREARLWMDTGAYADNGPRVVATAVDAAPGPYRWQAYRIDGWAVYTHTSPAGSYRSFGAAHLQWIGESQVDELARRMGRDPVAVRVANLLRPGEVVRPGGKPLDADLVGDVQRIAAALDWDRPRAEGTGRAVSVGLLAAGAHPVSTAIARLQADGTVMLLGGTTEMGQGARTVMAQIVAHELDIAPQRVRVVHADTDFTPYDRSTGASRSTTVAGKAVQLAAAHLREKILAIAARVLGAPAEALTVREGAVGWGAQRLTYEELLRRHYGLAGGELIGVGEVAPERGSGSFAEGPVFWEVCAAGAEVAVDPETGQARVRRLVTVADVGRAINPLLIKAQEQGAGLQGLGNALLEEIVLDGGQIRNPTLVDYPVPGWHHMPDAADSIIVENADGPGPYGAKGTGEGALTGALGAIAGALADCGVDLRRLPATPERLWQLLRQPSADVEERGQARCVPSQA